MDRLVKQLITPFITEQVKAKKVIAVYPGRFQPAGIHHYKTYKWLDGKFDKAYVATSDKTDSTKSPLNFKEKKMIWTKHKVKNVVKVKNPYVCEELLKKYDPNTTAVVYIFGEKDVGRLKTTKADGSPAYYQSYEKNKNDLKPYGEHGYFIVAPHVSIKVLGKEVSGTRIRDLLGSPKHDKMTKTQAFEELFGWYDEKIFNYLKGKPMSPKGDNWEKALNYWNSLKTDDDASFDQELNLNAGEIVPMITWGTSPQDVITIDEKVPNPQSESDEDKKNSIERALKYMGLKPDMAAKDIKIDKVFIGSCTNGRIEDLREAAKILKDKKISSHVSAMVVPGSGLVKEQAEQEGLDQIFVNSGFEWREPGCSMCLAMNADKLKPEERCASTSNRNFEGRQGRGGRTHLVSPGMAAAAAISGNLDDVRKYQN